MRKVILIIVFFATVMVYDIYPQSVPQHNCGWVDDETEFVVRNNPIRVFRATSYIRYYSDMVYRIKNTGTITLKVIYSSETAMDLEPGCSIDLIVENADLIIDSDHSNKGTGTYRIVNIVKP